MVFDEPKNTRRPQKRAWKCLEMLEECLETFFLFSEWSINDLKYISDPSGFRKFLYKNFMLPEGCENSLKLPKNTIKNIEALRKLMDSLKG